MIANIDGTGESTPLLETEPTFAIGQSTVLFDVTDASPSQLRNYDVSPDGQRFLMAKGSAALPTNQIIVVQNWFEELKSRVPVPH